MFIYKKRSRNRSVLAKKGADEYRHSRTCPACGKDLRFSESSKDRDTFVCTGCDDVVTFTQRPDMQNPEPQQKKLKNFILRDKSPRPQPINKIPKIPNQHIKEIVNILRSAMTEKSIVSFDYVSSDKRKSLRNVEPYKLTVRGGEFFLFAFDLESGGIRTFKVPMLSSVEKQPYGFDPRWDIEDTTVVKGTTNVKN